MPIKVLFVYSVFENIGVEYLSASLKQQGHQTHLIFDPRLFDLSSKNFSNRALGRIFSMRKRLVIEAQKYDPDLIAFSAVSADYKWALDFAGELKKVTKAPTVFGGYHPTAIPEKVIKEDAVDYVIVGEGEQAIVELASGLEKGEVDPEAPNLWLKHNGSVKGNPPAPLIQNLDELPMPDKDLFYSHGSPFNIGYMAMGRRGCENACSYCANNLRRKLYYGDKYKEAKSYLRRRSVGNLMEELKAAKGRYGIRIIRFNDDDFAENEDWLMEFRDRFRHEVNVPYKCFVNSTSINDRTVRLLRESGCSQVQMGVQTMNPRLGSVIGRHSTVEDIKRAIDLFSGSGITLSTDNMFGLPQEEVADYHNLAEFYLEHPVDFLNVYWLIYFPRTDIVRMAVESGSIDEETVRLIEDDPYRGDINRRTDLHPVSLMRYKLLFESYNYLPRSIFRTIVKRKLYRYFPPINFFLPLRMINVLRRIPKDQFPKPRQGYELVWLRHRKLMWRYILEALKITKPKRGAETA